MTVTLHRNTIEYDLTSRNIRGFRLRVLEAGEIITSTNYVNDQPFSHLFRLNYIVKGNAYMNTMDGRKQIPEGTLIFLLPQQILEVEEGSDPVHIMFVNFAIGSLDHSDSFVNNLERLLPEHTISDSANILYDYFLMILEEERSRRNGYALIIENLFRLILIHISRLCSNVPVHTRTMGRSNRSMSLYNEAVSYITRHISDNVRISEMAEHLSISEIYLYKIFTTYAGCSPKEYITTHKMKLAREYLTSSDEPIKNISDYLGYPDPNYFSSAFKKENGISPARFRMQAKQLK